MILVTAKEKLLEQLPRWTEHEAEVALAAVESEAGSIAEDDEPWTEADETAVAEVHADRAAGRFPVPFDEVKRKHGLG